MTAATKVNNPLNIKNGRWVYRRRVKFAFTDGGINYYSFGKCTLPKHCLKFIK